MELCVEKLLSDFSTHADVNRLLQELRAVVFACLEKRIVSAVEEQLSDPVFLNRLKAVAASRAMSFKGYKPTRIRLLSGQALAVNSPYFAPVASKRRGGKKTPGSERLSSGLDVRGLYRSLLRTADQLRRAGGPAMPFL
jgi:hypothetical protein